MSHCCPPVNEAIKRHLRNATVAALEEGDDETAQELLALILPPKHQAPQLPTQQPILLAPALEVTEGPPRSYDFWAQVLRDKFVPFMNEHCRHTFTAFEALRWLQANVPLSTGDVETHRCGTPVWRSQASNALGRLKQMGVLQSEPRSKIYAISPAAERMQLMPTA